MKKGDLKSGTYPCNGCSRRDACNWRSCIKYIEWFSLIWKRIRKTFEREEKR